MNLNMSMGFKRNISAFTWIVAFLCAALAAGIGCVALNIGRMHHIRHPYIDFDQARALTNLIRRKGRISGWDEVRLLDEFPETAIQKLDAYFGFSAH